MIIETGINAIERKVNSLKGDTCHIVRMQINVRRILVVACTATVTKQSGFPSN